MNDQQLLDAGYEKYRPSFHQECAVALFQKCIRDKKGKKYYINITKWDFTPFTPDYSENIKYEAEVQFRHQNGEYVNVKALSGWGLQEVEKFYEDLWNTGWFKYNEEFEYEDDEEET